MDVSALIHDRTEEPAGLQYMVVVSVLIHALGLGAALFGPGRWLSPPPEPKPVMTITLGGGTPGPLNGGLTAIGGRPVQEQTPPDAPKRPEAVRPPAAS